MSQIIYVLFKRGRKTVIAGVADSGYETTENVVWYDNEVYRDTLDATYFGASILGATVSPATQTAGTIGGFGGTTIVMPTTTATAISIPATLATTYPITANSAAVISVGDEVAHLAPRYLGKTRTKLRWWNSFQGTVGASTNSTTTVTVASTFGMEVGGGVSGAGIPVGATIVTVTAPNTIVISQAATATASITLTCAGGKMLGHAWADQVISVSTGTFSTVA